MSGECAIDDTQALHPASETLPQGGPMRRTPSRLRFPGTTRTLRVRNLALWLSLAAHSALFALLLNSNLATPLPEPPPIVEVEFVEIAGAKGGGGAGAAPVQAAPSKGLSQPAAPMAISSTKQPAPTVEQRPQSASAAVAPAGAATGNAPATAGAGPGSGGGSGGGQGSGMGTSLGGGTGQGGVAVDRMPVVVRRIKPGYPMDARRRGISGQVLLRIYVDHEGSVREVQVQAAEPAGVFEEKAVEAVRKWRFEPAVHKGAPVGMWMTLPVRFALNG